MFIDFNDPVLKTKTSIQGAWLFRDFERSFTHRLVLYEGGRLWSACDVEDGTWEVIGSAGKVVNLLFKGITHKC